MRNIKYKYTILVMLAILIPLDIHLWRQYAITKITQNLSYAVCVAIFIVGIVGYYLTRQFYKRNGEKLTATIINSYHTYADAYKEVYGKRRKRRKISDADDVYAVIEYVHNGQKIKNLLYIPHPQSLNYWSAKNISVPIVVYKSKCIFDDDTFEENRKEYKANELTKKQINEAIENSNIIENEIDAIYQQLKDKYNLKLNKVVIKENGEVKVDKTITFKNDIGNMRLFKLGELIVFAVDYSAGQKVEVKLPSIEEAINAIEKFMNSDSVFEDLRKK